MADAKDPWFVLERSEALAALLLTDQDGVEIVSRRAKDDGVDLMVALDGRFSPPTRLFIVQVKGTLSADPADWVQGVQPLFRAGGGHLYLPTCVVVVEVRGNRAFYAWIAEPNGAKLTFHDAPALNDLDDAAVTAIVGRVSAYYNAMPTHLLPTG